MTQEWDVRPDGAVVLPPWDHTHRWGEWSGWKRREAPHEAEVQRTRVCLNGCDTEEYNTEYQPEDDA